MHYLIIGKPDDGVAFKFQFLVTLPVEALNNGLIVVGTIHLDAQFLFGTVKINYEIIQDLLTSYFVAAQPPVPDGIPDHLLCQSLFLSQITGIHDAFPVINSYLNHEKCF